MRRNRNGSVWVLIGAAAWAALALPACVNNGAAATPTPQASPTATPQATATPQPTSTPTPIVAATATPTLAAEAEVSIRDFAFQPMEVRIKVGQTVRWVNNGEFTHTSTSGNPGDVDAGSVWDSLDIPPGESFPHTFNEIGEFPFFCRNHNTMRGTVIVQPLGI